MPKSVAVIVNGNFFVAKPCDGFANIFYGLAYVGYYNITRLRITQ